MDTLTFISELTKALVWPVTLVVLVLLTRGHLARLLALLQRFKYKDFEFDFGRQIEVAKADAAEALGEAPRQQGEPSPAESRLVRLAEISPRAAVLEAYTAVEIEAMDAARRIGMPGEFPQTLTFRALKYLENSGYLDDALVSLLRDLRGLRNQAAHSPEYALTIRSALEYIQLSQGAIERLRSLTSADNQPLEPTINTVTTR
jgi:hypothetical protein